MPFPREDSETFAKQYGFWLLLVLSLVFLVAEIVHRSGQFFALLRERSFDVTARISPEQFSLNIPMASPAPSVAVTEVAFPVQGITGSGRVLGLVEWLLLVIIAVIVAVLGGILCREITKNGVFTDRVWQLSTALYLATAACAIAHYFVHLAFVQAALTHQFGQGYLATSDSVFPVAVALSAMLFMAYRSILVSGRKLKEQSLAEHSSWSV